jgi:hypothetical protein
LTYSAVHAADGIRFSSFPQNRVKSLQMSRLPVYLMGRFKHPLQYTSSGSDLIDFRAAKTPDLDKPAEPLYTG